MKGARQARAASVENIATERCDGNGCEEVRYKSRFRDYPRTACSAGLRYTMNSQMTAANRIGKHENKSNKSQAGEKQILSHVLENAIANGS